MRPVNLIPPEERPGGRAPMRSGPIAYIALGTLLAALGGVTALALTGNQIADRKTEIAQLRREDAAVRARAQRLAAYTQFRAMSERRVATVSRLADSRFDWERVIRELSRVLPGDVWLTSLNASAAAGVSVGGGSGGSGSAGGSSLRGSIAGPALEMTGCAAGQDGVARFVTALKDIDGVTRVGMQSSALSEPGEGAGAVTEGDGSGGGGASDCRTRGFIAQFQIVAAFDAAPVSHVGAEGGEAPAAPAPESEGSSEPTSGEG